MNKLKGSSKNSMCIIPNYYGDKPSDDFIKICGKAVLDELESVALIDQPRKASKKISFIKDNHKYELYKGINKSKGKSGRFIYNLYEICNFSEGNKINRVCRPIEAKKKTKNDSWKPSKRAIDYQVNPNRKYILNDKLGSVIDDSYLECEKEIIDKYNDIIGKQLCFHIYPCAFFELGLQGGIENALFMICNLNSGFTDDTDQTPSDIDAYEDEELRKIICEIRSGKIAGEPHIALLKQVRELPQGKKYPFVQWFENQIIGKTSSNGKEWIIDLIQKICGDKKIEDTYNWLAYHFASRELLFYHTKNGKIETWEKACQEIIKQRLSPHQEWVIKDIKRAIELRIPIFLTRQQEKWIEYAHLPEIKNYDLLFCCVKNQNISLTSNNVLLYRDRQENHCSEEYKKKAWDTLYKAIKVRYNKVEK